jgi:hypothetical protein
MQIVSFGGGTNSTAMVIGMLERGEPVDAVVFADTGAEKPETYKHRNEFSKWMQERGLAPIVTVQTQDRNGTYITLEQRCLTNKMLPSIAYGMKSCSEKHKIRPQEKWANNNPAIRAEWAAGRQVVKCIGYDADEPQRAMTDHSDDKWLYWHPLIEWGWGRAECRQAIALAGLEQPGKSSCFFCPNSKTREILWLRDKHPDLLARAIAMEQNAELTAIKGLGRNFAWGNLVKQGEIDFDAIGEMPCGCYDG